MNTGNRDFQLPGYTLIVEIYRNIKTVVYRAWQLDSITKQQFRRVVIKLLLSEYASHQELREFRDRYTTFQDLDLPGIVRVYDLIEFDCGIALIMEDCGGISLADYRQNNILTYTEILQIAIELAEILNTLHQQQIVHQDIKPANILIHPQRKEIKLIDLSIAVRLDRQLPEMLGNRLVGTLAYMSPEQTGRMNQGIDYRSDLYSLGVTLYELFTGKLPFDADLKMLSASEYANELIYCHLAKIAVPVAEIDRDLPPIISEIIAKLMSKNVENRYRTAFGLKADFQQCLDRWQQTRTIANFTLAQQDLSDKFTIATQLFRGGMGELGADRLFEIVNHLNLAIDLFQTPAERTTLAQYNLHAARKAKLSTAYVAAANYGQIGTQLLGIAGWKQQYRLTLSLHEILAEATLLSGDFQTVPALVHIALDRALTPLDCVKSYETLIHFHSLQQQHQQAIDCGLEILHQLGVKISPKTDRISLAKAIAQAKLALWGKSYQTLLDLPEMIAPAQTAPLRILNLLLMPAFLCSQELMVVLVTAGIKLTLRDGNTPLTAVLYSTYGIILASLGDFQQSYQMGKLALALNARSLDRSMTAEVKGSVAWFCQPWREHLRHSIPPIEESIQTAMVSGNLTTPGLVNCVAIIIDFYLGIPLAKIVTKISPLEDLLDRSPDRHTQQLLGFFNFTVENLRAPSQQPTVLASNSSKEVALIDRLKNNREFSALSTIYALKTFLAYIFDDLSTALTYADAQLPYEFADANCYSITQLWMFDALVRLAAYPDANRQVKRKLLHRATKNHRHLLKCARLMPANFQHKADLVAAEKCRVLGDFTTAMGLYDRAIEGAKIHGYIQEEAIANECAARFYHTWGKAKIAATYLQSAYTGYDRWGATAKTADLARRYPQLLAPILPSFDPLTTLATITHSIVSNSPSNPSLDACDLVAAIQASQALASILDLPGLIYQFCQILLKHSGATTCIPILLSHDALTQDRTAWQIYNAELDTLPSGESSFELHRYPLAAASDLPLKAIDFVRHSHEKIILDWVTTDRAILADEYFQRHQPQSAMCLPLLCRGELRGLVYLENRRTANLFTVDRQTVIEFIAAQVVNTLYNAQLYESISQRSAAMDAAIDGMAIIEKNGKFIYLNRSYAQIYGYSINELIGRDWSYLYDPDSVAAFEQIACAVLAQDRQWRGITIATRKDGSTFDRELTLFLLDNGRLISICRDITAQQATLRERDRAEIELFQTNERLAATNQELLRATQLKDEFLATMSHELRTPLNAILGLSEALQDEIFGAINPRQLNSLVTIEQSGQHLLSLINDLLDFSKISAGKLDLKIAEVSLHELCRSSLMLVKPQALKKHIEIDTQISVDLDKIYVDERRMRQVLINLLNNAVKFTADRGFVKLSVRLIPPLLGDPDERFHDSHCLCFSISDTGIGIANADLSKLFQPFVQIDSNLNRQYEGTGLGLVLVKQIVELHGGTVTIDSQVNQGSCFSVILPHPTWQLSEVATTLPTPPIILLVEDNEITINTFSSYLTAKGYQIILARNGLEAIEFTHKHHPDLILMDIQISEIDGLTAITHIRSQPEFDRIQIIALTALVVAGAREKCLADGANRYLTKPVKLKELDRTIQECLK
jgi:PAS domain S-box-containing protein